LRAEIVFIDEVGFSFLAGFGTTWAPMGETPVLRRVSQRRSVSTVAALTFSGKIHWLHFRHAIHGEDMVRFLKYLHKRLPGRLFIVMDHLKVHSSQPVKDYLRHHPEIGIQWLPSYAPELNPEEYSHGNVKGQVMNAAPETVEELQELADCGFAHLRHQPDVILGFLQHAGLIDG
jgi:DDE superfamily endonuclease